MNDEQSLEEELVRYIEYLQGQLVTPGWEAIRNVEAYRTFVRSRPAIATGVPEQVWNEYRDLICEFQPRTQFDSPTTRAVFEPILRDVMEAATQLGVATKRPVHLVNSTDISATPLSIPSSDSHLLFAGLGTMSFCNYWAKAFTKVVAYFVKDHGPVSMTSALLKETFVRHRESIVLPVKLCAFHSYFRTLVGFGEVGVEPGNDMCRMLLVDAMELFVVAHEIGHFFLEEKLSVDSPQKSGHMAELVCDQYALQLSRTAASKRDNWIAFTGGGAYLLFRAAGFSLPGDEASVSAEESDSHPPLETRAAELCRKILETTPEDQRPAVENYLADFSVVCDEIAAILAQLPEFEWPKASMEVPTT